MKKFVEAIVRQLKVNEASQAGNCVANNGAEFVAVVDRFLDRRAMNPFEWDDFISEKNCNPTLEDIRLELGQYEPLLFSNNVEDKIEYKNKVIAERNKIAVSLGLPLRNLLHH